MAGATSGLMIFGSISNPPNGIYRWAAYPVDGVGPNSAIVPNVSNWSGRYKVVGDCVQQGTLAPLARSVRLMDICMNVIIRTALTSGANGVYEFRDVAAGYYSVVGYDQNNVQNGVVAAYIQSVAM